MLALLAGHFSEAHRLLHPVWNFEILSVVPNNALLSNYNPIIAYIYTVGALNIIVFQEL